VLGFVSLLMDISSGNDSQPVADVSGHLARRKRHHGRPHRRFCRSDCPHREGLLWRPERLPWQPQMAGRFRVRIRCAEQAILCHCIVCWLDTVCTLGRPGWKGPARRSPRRIGCGYRAAPPTRRGIRSTPIPRYGRRFCRPPLGGWPDAAVGK